VECKLAGETEVLGAKDIVASVFYKTHIFLLEDVAIKYT
jgi:hypothetical protein